MNNIEELKSAYRDVELTARNMRGKPEEYRVVTGFFPVNVVEMQAQKIQALIAQLEASQKELFDFHNQEFQQRLANAEHQLYMKDLAIHNIKASRKAQFRKRLAAEAELSAANAKPKPISFDELADRVQFVTGGIRMSFDPLNCKGHQIVPFMNFNSLSRIVEMYRTTETYHLAGFTVGGGDTATIAPAPEGVVMRPPFKKPLEHCAAARDGKCSHKDCPQLRDNEPMATGRHCPIDDWDDE